MANFKFNDNYIFHVHTKRCRHATGEDEEYIEKAIEVGANSIIFLDHAPFPGNLFNKRMDYEQLDEYVETINALASKYRESISVKCGLEIEYLPSFDYYYQYLKKLQGIELLALGQHMYETEVNTYSFMLKDKTNEYIGLANAIIAGMRTGYFDVVVHPDRIFKRIKYLGSKEISKANEIVQVAADYNIPLEINKYSIDKKLLRKNFWSNVTDKNMIIYGLDAHSPSDIFLFNG